MNTQITDISETRKLFTLTFSGEETAAEAKSVMNDFRKHAQIKGFRPGKAPEHAILKQYGKKVAEEIDRKIINKAYRTIADDKEVDVFSFVEIDGSGFRGGEEATVKVTVDLNPAFELPNYKGLKVTVEPVVVTDEEVDGTLNRLLRERAEYNPVEREAAAGDYVKVSYEGKIGDETVANLLPDQPMYGTQKSTWEEAGATESPGVPAIVNGVLAMKAGDSKSVEETFAEDFPVEGLRGKTVSYSLSVEEVREVKLPEISDEFCQQLGAENEEQLRTRIRESIQQQKQQAQDGSKRSQVIRQITEPLDIPLPESALEEESQVLLRDFMGRQMQQGVSQEDLEARSEELVQGAATAASDRVKLQLILNSIAKAEKIEVDQKDMQQVIFQQAMQSRTPVDKIVDELKKDRERLHSLQRSVLFGKTLDFIVDAAEVTEAEGTAESAASSPAS